MVNRIGFLLFSMLNKNCYNLFSIVNKSEVP